MLTTNALHHANGASFFGKKMNDSDVCGVCVCSSESQSISIIYLLHVPQFT